MILLIDNFDSFTYNLVHYLGELGEEVEVRRNDLSVEEARKIGPSRIVISPGPGRPEDAGFSIDIIRAFAGRVPILGVCLGHQAIAAAFGGTIVKAKQLVHGKTSQITHDGRTLFRSIPSPFEATRYHSLVVREDDLPDVLEVSARSEDGEVMGLRHRGKCIEGAQFHPESIMTGMGKSILGNFCALPEGADRIEEHCMDRS